jgi:hypothetical protein
MYYLMLLLFSFGLFEAWFKTGLPVHVFEILFRITKKPKLWPFDWEPGYNAVTRKDWETSVNAEFPYLGEMLTCPRCFSWHLGFWTSLAFALATQNILLFFLGFTTIPAVVNFLSSLQTKIES